MQKRAKHRNDKFIDLSYNFKQKLCSLFKTNRLILMQVIEFEPTKLARLASFIFKGKDKIGMVN